MVTRTKRGQARVSMDIPINVKEAIETEAKRRCESMTAVLARAWLVYQMARDGELYHAHYITETKLGGNKQNYISHYTKLEIL